MSYILDALRKSEQERAPVDGLSIGRHDPGPGLLPPRRVLTYAAPLVGALAIVGGAYLLWAQHFFDRSPVDGDAATDKPASIVAAPQESVEPSPRPAMAPTFKPLPMLAAQPPASKPVRDLVEQTRVSRPAPSPAVEPTAKRVAAVPVAAARAPAADNVPFLRSLAPEVRQGLPELVVNIHVYATNEAERILYINNRPYQAGERVRDDIVVEEIVEDGAVLSYRGQRFKLPRPS